MNFMDKNTLDANQNTPNEFWQAEVLGQIYDTNFIELAQWIDEGSLTPDDKVKRGNLRWIEARKVPMLIPFFNAKKLGIEPPIIHTSVTDGTVAESRKHSETENFADAAAAAGENLCAEAVKTPAEFTQTENVSHFEDQNELLCVIHPESEAVFHCEICANNFCPQCPKSYGGSVKICPMCGAMCKKIGETDEKRAREIQYAKAIKEGFGFKDIGNAFLHPFKFKTSLVFGGVMFMLFTLGQSAGAIGGLFMMFAALFCYLLANMLGFGVLSNTIENFSQGKLQKNFMPDFEDFNLWDDVIHPCFLSIGVYISSFGPLVLAVIIGSYLLISSMTEQMKKMETEKAQVSSPFLIDEQKVQNQSDEVKKLIESVKQKAAEKKDLTENNLPEKIVSSETAGAQKTEDEKIDEINQMIQQNRKQELESVVGKTDETKRQEFNQLASSFLNLGLPLLLLTGAALLWGVFYFPAACAVAGYTRSFWATVNPSVGIDTIKHFGADYLKIFGIFILFLIASGIVGGILNIALSPLSLPGMGNLPAIAISSWITFYFTIVFSCLLGYALFKNSDKFKFYKG